MDSTFSRDNKAISRQAPTFIFPTTILAYIRRFHIVAAFGLHWLCYCLRNIQRNKQQAYRNFKGFDMRFTFIAAAWEGIAHDSRVLENVIVDPEAVDQEMRA
ncbi:hypothetical protein P3S67_024998 [Capsicum chacoense]